MAAGADRERSRWQLLLLPLMAAIVVGLTVFFFSVSRQQLEQLQTRIAEAPAVDLQATFGGPAPDIETERWRTLALLEQNALEHRYRQAKVLLMSRLWLKYLGFVTGMIIAIVGAAFVLGRLRGSGGKGSVEGGGIKAAFETTSPGLVLAFLGAGLMLTTMVSQSDIQVTDRAVYTANWQFAAPRTATRSGAAPGVMDPEEFFGEVGPQALGRADTGGAFDPTRAAPADEEATP